MSDDGLTYDLLIIGGGPAGLSAAIRAKQRAQDAGRDISIALLDKGAEIGAHILSGAVVDPRALDELLPDWRSQNDHPLVAPVHRSEHWFLGAHRHFVLPHALMPPLMQNRGCYTLSLGNLCRWLAQKAQALGVDIFPGFAAASPLFAENGTLSGVMTGAMGLARDGTPGENYQPGVPVRAAYSLIAEGARGSLAKQLIAHFALDRDRSPQIFALGVKELWDIDPEKHEAGRVVHTQGWPLGDVPGGGFIYHQADHQLALGLVTSLGYRNPSLSPFSEMQRWKQHPAIRSLLEGGRRVSYGARVIAEGGVQALPRLIFPGGALIGCAAGFVNVPRIKGTHTAMKSGMMAADAVVDALCAGRAGDELDAYVRAYETSWVRRELNMARNIAPAMTRFGARWGTLYAGLDLWAQTCGVPIPWTLQHQADHLRLQPIKNSVPIAYPPPDGKVSFDRPSSVFLANLCGREGEPVHLHLGDPDLALSVNLAHYDEPAQRYCPAGVYEILDKDSAPRLQINAANCLHCKACDVKDPCQNITWTVPEGGDGPCYPNM